VQAVWRSLFLAGAVFALLLYPWLARRAWRTHWLVALGALWIAASLGLAYTQFRSICARPLTCDVAGPEAAQGYLVHVFAPLAIEHGVALALVAVAMGWREQRRPLTAGPREVALGAGVTLAAWLFAVGALAVVDWSF
jgi:hypothetical protein